MNNAMNSRRVNPVSAVTGEVILPGDKSISHRSIIFSSMMKEDIRIHGLLESEDIEATMRACSALGVEFQKQEDSWQKKGIINPSLASTGKQVFLGNSGTSIRLLSGFFAGMPGVEVEFYGDESLNRRPMLRVADPLRSVGADIRLSEKGTAPIHIKGKSLQDIRYYSPISSAQVKSSLMLAAISSEINCEFAEMDQSRDHTERFLEYLGISLQKREFSAGDLQDLGFQLPADHPLDAVYHYYKMEPPYEVMSRDIEVPGDISSAAFFLVLATILPDSKLRIKNLGLNPSRTGILEALQRMGAQLQIEEKASDPEPMGDIIVRSARTHGEHFSGSIIPNIIDEIPILSVLAAFSEGETVFQGVSELRVKESDRIDAICRNLRSCGIEVEEWSDGFRVKGSTQKVRGGKINSLKDHRIVMSFSVLGLASSQGVEIDESQWVDTSFPGFYSILEKISR